jgi:hypothetical protein
MARRPRALQGADILFGQANRGRDQSCHTLTIQRTTRVRKCSSRWRGLRQGGEPRGAGSKRSEGTKSLDEAEASRTINPPDGRLALVAIANRAVLPTGKAQLQGVRIAASSPS